jgi:hypothetical protein
MSASALPHRIGGNRAYRPSQYATVALAMRISSDKDGDRRAGNPTARARRQRIEVVVIERRDVLLRIGARARQPRFRPTEPGRDASTTGNQTVRTMWFSWNPSEPGSADLQSRRRRSRMQTPPSANNVKARLLARILPRRDRADRFAIDVVDRRDQRGFVLRDVIAPAGLLDGGAPLRVRNAFAEFLVVIGANEIQRDLVVDGALEDVVEAAAVARSTVVSSPSVKITIRLPEASRKSNALKISMLSSSALAITCRTRERSRTRPDRRSTTCSATGCRSRW